MAASDEKRPTYFSSFSQHKEEMGEVLHVIDFDQLKIENQQYCEFYKALFVCNQDTSD